MSTLVPPTSPPPTSPPPASPPPASPPPASPLLASPLLASPLPEVTLTASSAPRIDFENYAIKPRVCSLPREYLTHEEWIAYFNSVTRITNFIEECDNKLAAVKNGSYDTLMTFHDEMTQALALNNLEALFEKSPPPKLLLAYQWNEYRNWLVTHHPDSAMLTVTHPLTPGFCTDADWTQYLDGVVQLKKSVQTVIHALHALLTACKDHPPQPPVVVPIPETPPHIDNLWDQAHLALNLVKTHNQPECPYCYFSHEQLQTYITWNRKERFRDSDTFNDWGRYLSLLWKRDHQLLTEKHTEYLLRQEPTDDALKVAYYQAKTARIATETLLPTNISFTLFQQEKLRELRTLVSTELKKIPLAAANNPATP